MWSEEMLLLSSWDIHVVTQKQEFPNAVMPGEIEKLEATIRSIVNEVLSF